MIYLLGPKELAKAFNVTETWVRQLVKQGYPDSDKDGKYNLVAWIQHREKDFQDKIKAARDKGVTNLERRKEEIEVKLKEYDLARKKGELVPTKIPIAIFTRITKTLVDLGAQLGTKVGSRYQGELGREIKKHIDDAWEEIAKEVERGKSMKLGTAGIRQLTGVAKSKVRTQKSKVKQKKK